MKTLLSIDEFEKLPVPEQGGGYELDEGEPVYVSPNSLEEFRIIYRLYSLLSEWAKTDNRGLVAADTWIELAPAWYVPRTLRTSRASEFPILIPSTP